MQTTSKTIPPATEPQAERRWLVTYYPHAWDKDPATLREAIAYGPHHASAASRFMDSHPDAKIAILDPDFAGEPAAEGVRWRAHPGQPLRCGDPSCASAPAASISWSSRTGRCSMASLMRPYSPEDQAERQLRLVNALGLAFSTTRDVRLRLKLSMLHQQAMARYRRLVGAPAPEPTPPPPPGARAPRPRRHALPDGVHLNLRYGNWDVIRGGRRIAAALPRLEAEQTYDRAA